MAKKIDIIGAQPKRIRIVNSPKLPLDPAEVAEGLGARPCGERVAGNLDPIALGELGSQLLARLRSSGGRPALADATEICRVPLSGEDVRTLEQMVEQLQEASGTKPSVGQLIGVIVRAHLQSLRSGADSTPESAGQLSERDRSPSLAVVRRLVEEQIRPLREQVQRLETEMHTLAAGKQ